MQLDQSERGFSFSKEGPLDMRMDPSMPISAKEAVNTLPEEELGRIFREYGEERAWKKLAQTIVHERRKKPIETTRELSQIILSSIGKGFKRSLHPATLIFQALRIYVNRELESIETALIKAISLLRSGGRIGVLSFHSLEDRIVKNTFRSASFLSAKQKKQKCTPILHLLTKKPLRAAFSEVRRNPRARSALFRLAEKL